MKQVSNNIIIQGMGMMKNGLTNLVSGNVVQDDEQLVTKMDANE